MDDNSFPDLYPTSPDKNEQRTGENRVEREEPRLSKKQMKRKLKLERMLATRKKKRELEKERRKLKKAAKPVEERKQQPKFFAMNESKLQIKVAIDMGFDELMDGRTVKKTVTQLGYCYAANRRSTQPLQLYIVNLDGKAKEIFDSGQCYSNWDVHMKEQSLKDLWCKEEIVYLTADSENILDTVDENKVYIIGGLLDHNHYKGTCLKKAQENGFGHARLPIDSYFKLSGRKVLTINQVFEILVHFSQHSNWEEAFLNTIPRRKGIEQKEVCGGITDHQQNGQDILICSSTSQDNSSSIVEVYSSDQAEQCSD